MICTAANGLWLATCLGEAARFRRATTRVAVNRDTEFGRRHGFRSARKPRDYRQRVPVRSYAEYEGEVDRIADGTQRVLTRDRVRIFEPTGGSASATKLIPYTPSLRREFQRGIKPWIADLFTHSPDLMRGQAYWSVSPVSSAATRTRGGIPIGFEDDSAYVGSWRRVLVRQVMAAPASLRNAADIEAFQYQTLLALVRSDNLRLMSIWNPSFLAVILERLPQHANQLLRDLRDDPDRARPLRAALKASTPSERHALLWPRLRLISCWADANAAGAAAALASAFPQARLQPKGLIATEGFVSFPLCGVQASALAVRSHFFEFAPIGSSGEADEDSPVLAHELDEAQRYTVIISTGGGLYRYRLNDVIEVIGHVAECPLIRFVGKHEYVSDWVGEKLHEAHVAAVLRDAFERVPPAFAMLACDRELSPPAYVLYVDSDADDATLTIAGAAVEDGLRRNFQYDYARFLGQLGRVQIFRAEEAARTYMLAAMSAGQRAGDIKPLALDRRDGWSRRFRGRFIPTPSRSTPFGSGPLRLSR
jgi:hypothetical protein